LIELYSADVELVPGVAGVFEITVDGKLLFSKKQTGRFPTDEEVDALGAGGSGTP
jgi:selT/selW/selH-like putative selenoprotein